MKKISIFIVLLTVFFLVASASAMTHDFGATSGDSSYAGAVAVNEDGTIAVTVAAVAHGTLNANPTADDTAGASVEQTDTAIEGDAALAISMASNGDHTATTGDLAAGDDAEVDTTQIAEAIEEGSSAVQMDSMVTGDVAIAASTASSSRGASEEIVAVVEDGVISDTSQIAGVGEGVFTSGDHMTGGQNTIASGENVIVASTLSDSAGKDTASTVAGGTDVTVVSYQLVDSYTDDGVVYAEQDSLIVGGAGSTAFTASEAKSDNGDSAKTGNSAEAGTGILVIETHQESETSSFLTTTTADQESIVVGSAHAEAGSSSESEDGDQAKTVAQAHNGGGIVTAQGAVAGAGSFGPVEVEGAAAAQDTEITAFNGASASSDASNRDLDEGAAFTVAGISGSGGISTIQGAGAGEVELDIAGLEIEAEGAVAAQGSDMHSTNSGNAMSGANNELDNSADTQVGYTGIGQIDGTIQGAAAGEFEVELQGDDIAGVEGAAAIQHTDNVDTFSPDRVVWVTSSSYNENENNARTVSRATGMFATIEGTTQGAAAGEVEVDLLDIDAEAEGAVVIQHIDVIHGARAETSAESSNENENSANTAVVVENGYIADTTLGAAAGEIELDIGPIDAEAEGAVVIQHTEDIIGLNGYATSDSSSLDPTNARTEARFFGVGSITDTTQGAGAGEVEVNIGPIEVEAEGAAAAQHTGTIQSTLGGFATSTATSEDNDEGSAGTIAVYGSDGHILGTTQGAAVGEAEIEFHGHDIIEVEGAVAAQHTDEIASDTSGYAASWANNEDENSALTGAVFFGPGDIDETTQGGAAGEIEIFGHEVAEGAVVGQFTDNIASTNGGGAGALSVSEDGDFAVTAAVYLSDGSIDDTLVGAAAGEVDTGHVFFLPDVQVEGAGAVQHTDAITDEFGAFTVSFASQPFADEGFAVTTNGFLFGEGTITETTQGAVAGETEFRIHHTNVELEGAAAIQHTDDIDSDGLGWAASISNNEFDNFAFTADAYTFGGEIYQTTQGAVAGEIELEHHHHDLELEGAAAGQFTEGMGTIGPGFVGTGALHEEFGPDDFDSTGPGFMPPNSVIAETFGIAAAGEIEDGFSIDGAIAFP